MDSFNDTAGKLTDQVLSEVKARNELDPVILSAIDAAREIGNKLTTVEKDYRNEVTRALSRLYVITHIVRSNSDRALDAANAVARMVGQNRPLNKLDDFELVLAKNILKSADNKTSSLYARALRGLWNQNVPGDQAEAELVKRGVRHFADNSSDKPSGAKTKKEALLNGFKSEIQTKDALATVTLNKTGINPQEPMVMIAVQNEQGQTEIKMVCANEKINSQVVALLCEYRKKTLDVQAKKSSAMVEADKIAAQIL